MKTSPDAYSVIRHGYGTIQLYQRKRRGSMRTGAVAHRGGALTQRDVLGLVLSYLYAFGLLFGAEALGKRLHLPQFVTRKLVHIGAGMWVWGVIGLFDAWQIGIIPFASFIALNYAFYRFRTFRAMDAVDESPGTVYFALSITLLFALLWRNRGPVDRVPIAVAAIMAMTWGDGLASLVGHSLGRHRYTVFGHARSWEGSVAMGVAAFVAIVVTVLLLSDSAWSPFSAAVSLNRAIVAGAVATLVATAAEGLSPAGTDNLTVPLLTALTLLPLLG